MQISFIVGNLSLGVDGIADYTLTIAKNCIQMGHACQIISLRKLSDANLAQINDLMMAYPEYLSISDIPQSESASDKKIAICKQLEAFDPGHISLQFMYQQCRHKNSIKYLSEILREQREQGRKIHVLVHEIWKEYQAPFTLRDFIFSQIKKVMIDNFLREAQPHVIHTTNIEYLSKVAALGFQVDCLPVFSNIPVAPRNEYETRNFMSEMSQLDLVEHRENYWVFGIFGAITRHSKEQWKVEPLFSQIESAAQRFGKKILIVSIGRRNAWSDQQWNVVSKKYQNAFRFVSLGSQPANIVSQVLQEIDWGITAVPFPLLCKSTTIAAIVEHGSTVIFNLSEPSLENKADLGLYQREQLHFGFFPDLQTEDRGQSQVGDGVSSAQLIARKFLESLARLTQDDINASREGEEAGS